MKQVDHPHPRLASLTAIALGGAAFFIGCSADVSSAIDIELVPDPSLNSEAQVAAALDTVALIVDSPEGLYPPGSERSDGNVRILNFIPTDPELELVATMPVGEMLPTIRFERGGLPDKPLDFWFRGLPTTAKPNTPTAAEYRVHGVRFEEGVTELKVPFNLLPPYLPLRVDSVEPSEGSTLSDCSVPVIAVVMSKPVDAASLLMDGNVTLEPLGVREIRVPTAAELGAYAAMAGRLVQIYPTEVGGPSIDSLVYRLVISSGVTDVAGDPLDQMPGQDGAQPFDVEYLFNCAGQSPVQHPTDGPGCGELQRCPTAELVCVEGLCVRRCEAGECGGGSICSDETGLCIPDCRLYAEATICSADRPRCDGETGECRP